MGVTWSNLWALSLHQWASGFRKEKARSVREALSQLSCTLSTARLITSVWNKHCGTLSQAALVFLGFLFHSAFVVPWLIPPRLGFLFKRIFCRRLCNFLQQSGLHHNLLSGQGHFCFDCAALCFQEVQLCWVLWPWHGVYFMPLL